MIVCVKNWDILCKDGEYFKKIDDSIILGTTFTTFTKCCKNLIPKMTALGYKSKVLFTRNFSPETAAVVQSHKFWYKS